MGSVAFFDVDDTLTINGMVSFAAAFAPKRATVAEFTGRVRALYALQAGGADRDLVSVEYFQLFAGEPLAHLRDEGARWAAAQIAGGGFFVPAVLARLRTHQAAGDKVVFVSGSFEALLRPVARELGVTGLLSTRLEVTGGIVSGATFGPMVGERKAGAVRSWARLVGVNPTDCFAYGDHASDEPMLAAVGHSVAVIADPPADPGFHARAVAAGWEILRS